MNLCINNFIKSVFFGPSKCCLLFSTQNGSVSSVVNYGDNVCNLNSLCVNTVHNEIQTVVIVYLMTCRLWLGVPGDLVCWQAVVGQRTDIYVSGM